MPKRKVDPTTGDPELTYREQRFLDEFITNGGNASRAAAFAGYSAVRSDQSAYQVLRRPEVQRRIAQRIAESRVTADEIIGTLASLMRGTLADFLDESGDFSMDLAIQRGVDHQLKNITTTTREIKATKDRPAQILRTYRVSLHSSIQAARALAHILGIDRNRPTPCADPDSPGASEPVVSETSLDLAPLSPSPGPDQPSTLAAQDYAAYGPVSPVGPPAAPNATTSEAVSDYTPFDPTYHHAFSRLSARKGDALADLRFRDLVQEWVDTRNLTEAQALNAIRERAASEELVFALIVDACIEEYRGMRAAGLIREPDRFHFQDSQPNHHSPLGLDSITSQNPIFINVSAPLPDDQGFTNHQPLPEKSIFTNVLPPDQHAHDSELAPSP